jgi:hypothetical protein
MQHAGEHFGTEKESRHPRFAKFDAQINFEAQVRGVVRDSSGSVIVSARVTITDSATNISNLTATDARGLYIFNGLHPATFTIKAEASGIRAEEAKNVRIDVSQHTSLTFLCKWQVSRIL